MMRLLDIGCGIENRSEDTVGLDMNLALLKSGDVCFEMKQDRRYLPFSDNSFDKMRLIDVVEHLPDIPWWMSEIHRVGTPNADVHIKYPHYSCRASYADTTHINHLSMHAFDHFDPNTHYGSRYPLYNNFGRNFPFEMRSIGIHFYECKAGKILNLLAKLKGNDFYELCIANVFPIATVELYMKVKK